MDVGEVDEADVLLPWRHPATQSDRLSCQPQVGEWVGTRTNHNNHQRCKKKQNKLNKKPSGFQTKPKTLRFVRVIGIKCERIKTNTEGRLCRCGFFFCSSGGNVTSGKSSLMCFFFFNFHGLPVSGSTNTHQAVTAAASTWRMSSTAVFYCPLDHEPRQTLFGRCKSLDATWLNDANDARYLPHIKRKRTKST